MWTRIPIPLPTQKASRRNTMALKLHTTATLPAVTLAETKMHLRVDSTAEDTLIAGLVTAATADAEHLMGRAIMPQKWVLTLDSFSSVMTLQRPTVTAVDSVKYVDSTGALVTLSPTLYQVSLANDYTATIMPAYGQTWPETREQPDAVQIIFSTGYADAASVPESIKAWIKLRVGTLYETRASVVVDRGMSVAELSLADSLLSRYRVWCM